MLSQSSLVRRSDWAPLLESVSINDGIKPEYLMECCDQSIDRKFVIQLDESIVVDVSNVSKFFGWVQLQCSTKFSTLFGHFEKLKLQVGVH